MCSPCVHLHLGPRPPQTLHWKIRVIQTAWKLGSAKVIFFFTVGFDPKQETIKDSGNSAKPAADNTPASAKIIWTGFLLCTCH